MVADELELERVFSSIQFQRYSDIRPTRNDQELGKQTYIPRRLNNDRLERTGHGKMVASDGATRLPSHLPTHASANALAHAAKPIIRITSWQKEALSIGENESCGGSGALTHFCRGGGASSRVGWAVSGAFGPCCGRLLMIM
jgi:hypothetical protein